MRLFLIILLFLGHICQLYCQDPVHSVINHYDGLSSNTIFNMNFDENGLLYIGHAKGLSRYNSLTFKDYQKSNVFARAVSNIAPYQGRIICQNFSGELFVTQGDSLIHINKIKRKGPYLPIHIVGENLAYISENNLFMTPIASLFHKENTITSYPQLTSKDEPSFMFQNKLVQIKEVDKKITQTTLCELPNTDINYSLIVDKKVYLASKLKYSEIFTCENNKVKPIYTLKKGLFLNDLIRLDNEIWVLTTTGAYCFDLNFNPKYEGKCFFEKYSISCIVKSKDNSYWFGTLGHGVIKVKDIKSESFSSNEIISSYCKLNETSFMIGKENNNVEIHNLLNKKAESVKLSKLNQKVIELATIENGEYTLTSSDKVRLLKGNKVVDEIDLISGTFCNKGIGKILIGHANGIAAYKIENDHLRIDKLAETELAWLQQFAQKKITKIVKIKADYFINSTEKSFLVKQGKLIPLTYENRDIKFKFISSINNKTVLMTGDNTILKYENEKLIYIDKINLDFIKGYIFDNNKAIYFSDNKAYYSNSIYPTQKLNILYQLDKGEDFVDIGTIKDKNVLISNKSINLIDTAKSIEVLHPEIFIHKTFMHDIEVAPPFNFSPDQNNFTIQFEFVNYSNREYDLFYLLNNRKVKINEGERQIRFSALEPGNYNLILEAREKENNSLINTTNLGFIITKPFYKTWWFFSTVLFFAGLLINRIVSARIAKKEASHKKILETQQLENDLNESILTSIRSQMNPHFIFNALNTIQSYIYQNDKEKASFYLNKFSVLTRKILETSAMENISLKQEIEILKSYLDLEKQRFGDSFTFTLDVDKELELEFAKVPTMMLQPFIENSIKHGLLNKLGLKWVKIEFINVQDDIKIIIDDNGIGREKSKVINEKIKNHSSFSTSAINKRIEILNKNRSQKIQLEIIDKFDKNNEATGTKVIIIIPNH
jgi:hypothetical protein